MRNRTPIPTARELRQLFEYEDGCLYWKVSRHKKPTEERVRAGFFVKVSGYRGVTINGVSYAEHRIIWRMHNPRGAMPFVLDHKDGDRTNNRITNLRKATENENQNNRHPGLTPKVVGSGKLQQFLSRRRVQ